MSMQNPPDKVLHAGRFLSMHERDGWELVTRHPKSSGVVAVLALTEARELILIEQHRRPVNARVVEICAGLVGDEPEFQHESLAGTARREFLEETGYHAEKITHLLSSPASAGMTDEITHFFLATQVSKKHAGGGVGDENIEVHHVPLASFPKFVAAKQNDGCLIDGKIHTALELARDYL